MDVTNRLKCNWIETMSESFISNQSNGVQARMNFGEALWFGCVLRPLVRTWKHMNVSMIAVLWKRTGEDALLRQETGENVFGFWQRKACGSMACLSWREFVLLTTISKQFA